MFCLLFMFLWVVLVGGGVCRGFALYLIGALELTRYIWFDIAGVFYTAWSAENALLPFAPLYYRGGICFRF